MEMVRPPNRPVVWPRRARSSVLYWILDWPRFVVTSAAAWYFTLIGIMGIVLLLGAVATLVSYWLGIP
jgi:hypothetical protein